LRVIQAAFAAGIKQVSRHQVQLHREGRPGVTRDVVEIETSTPSWRLVGQGLGALMLSTVLIIAAAAACVAYFTDI
jgi:hypothetical protein